MRGRVVCIFNNSTNQGSTDCRLLRTAPHSAPLNDHHGGFVLGWLYPGTLATITPPRSFGDIRVSCQRSRGGLTFYHRTWGGGLSSLNSPPQVIYKRKESLPSPHPPLAIRVPHVQGEPCPAAEILRTPATPTAAGDCLADRRFERGCREASRRLAPQEEPATGTHPPLSKGPVSVSTDARL